MIGLGKVAESRLVEALNKGSREERLGLFVDG